MRVISFNDMSQYMENFNFSNTKRNIQILTNALTNNLADCINSLMSVQEAIEKQQYQDHKTLAN